MTPAPCPTCRHYVIHLAELGRAIRDLRIAATRRHIHARLMHHVTVGRSVKALLAKHRRDDGCDQRRDAIRDLAAHLTDHADEEAAA